MELGQLIGQASHLFRERADARMAKYKITPSQAHVIIFLDRRGGQVSQQSLGAHLRVKPSTVNGIVDRLAERSLVERSADAADARRKYVALTDRGRATLELFHQELRDMEDGFIISFTPQEQETLRQLLTRMIEILEEDRKKC